MNLREYQKSTRLGPKTKGGKAVLRWKQAHPERAAAHKMVFLALRAGRIARPSSCESCGLAKPLHAHHENYENPMKITWMCAKCHGKRHIAIRNENVDNS